MPRPYYVHGGWQDSGSWAAPSQPPSKAAITNASWFRTGGGDGFYSQAAPNDPYIIYSESQNGSMARIYMRTGLSTSIRPRTTPQRPGGGGGGGRRAGRGAAHGGVGAGPASAGGGRAR